MEDLAKEGKLFLFAIVVAIMVSVFFFPSSYILDVLFLRRGSLICSMFS